MNSDPVNKSSPEILWQPSAERIERARLTEYMRWLRSERGLDFEDYEQLWHWSTDDLDAFWGSIWDFFGVQADGGYEGVLGKREMPGAEWFSGASLNYAEHVFAGKDKDEPAILEASELRDLDELSWGELGQQVAALAAALRQQGVGRGDRVVAYLPNIAEAVIAFLASASIGAVWSSCSPDFGPASVIDRFAQIEPKILFGVDGYRYGGKDFDRIPTLAQVGAEIPSLTATVVLPYLDPQPDLSPLANSISWDQLLTSGRGAELSFERVPFEHPLWVLYLRHNRTAKSDSPKPGGDPARASKEAPPPRRRPSGRAAFLVHHHRLDDVELPRLGPFNQSRDRPL